jgi:conjugative transfer signal peptidase TraF
VSTSDTLPAEQLASHRRARAEAARIWRWMLVSLLIFWALVIQMIAPPAPRLLWNASASAPVGLYRVVPAAALARGDMVIARTPIAYRRLAAVRRYIPENVPLVKRVAATRGDQVCALGARISVNGRQLVRRLANDARHRAMPWWRGCRTLGAGEYLLLMREHATSFDGRYFGITGQADVVGKATLLWAR